MQLLHSKPCIIRSGDEWLATGKNLLGQDIESGGFVRPALYSSLYKVMREAHPAATASLIGHMQHSLRIGLSILT